MTVDINYLQGLIEAWEPRPDSDAVFAALNGERTRRQLLAEKERNRG